MREFFEGVGQGADAAGYNFGAGLPVPRPEFKERFAQRLAARARKRLAEEMI
jgi:hypothetical protein